VPGLLVDGDHDLGTHCSGSQREQNEQG